MSTSHWCLSVNLAILINHLIHKLHSPFFRAGLIRMKIQGPKFKHCSHVYSDNKILEIKNIKKKKKTKKNDNNNKPCLYWSNRDLFPRVVRKKQNKGESYQNHHFLRNSMDLTTLSWEFNESELLPWFVGIHWILWPQRCCYLLGCLFSYVLTSNASVTYKIAKLMTYCEWFNYNF